MRMTIFNFLERSKNYFWFWQFRHVSFIEIEPCANDALISINLDQFFTFKGEIETKIAPKTEKQLFILLNVKGKSISKMQKSFVTFQTDPAYPQRC